MSWISNSPPGCLSPARASTLNPDRVDRILRNAIDTDRRLNMDFGIRPEQDTLPHRFTSEPLEEGASKGQVVAIEKMVKDYYRLRGWDEQGRPPEKTVNQEW